MAPPELPPNCISALQPRQALFQDTPTSRFRGFRAGAGRVAEPENPPSPAAYRVWRSLVNRRFSESVGNMMADARHAGGREGWLGTELTALGQFASGSCGSGWEVQGEVQHHPDIDY
eukprot:scaffold1741_cov262-Pinguiococcus_pyrenoidosus.AAC.39